MNTTIELTTFLTEEEELEHEQRNIRWMTATHAIIASDIRRTANDIKWYRTRFYKSTESPSIQHSNKLQQTVECVLERAAELAEKGDVEALERMTNV